MVAGSNLMVDTSIYRHMLRDHVTVFARAAAWYKVYILVRRTNPESLQYIGRKGYAAKPIDCKAKTADCNVTVNGVRAEIAGLVVDPQLVGAGAFGSTRKYAEAMKEWGKFRSHLAPAGHAYVPPDQPYDVQGDPSQPHFGAVCTYGSGGLRHPKARIFIHGDYDLFAIVPVENKTENIFVQETLRGQPHSRGQQLMDVQNYLNRNMGVPMVLHGEQDHFKAEVAADEAVDVFMPDGINVRSLTGAQITSFYEEELSGRRLHQAGGATDSHFGLWQVSRP